MAGYKVYTVSSANYADRQLVDPATCSWGRASNGTAGGFQATFKLSDPNVAAVYTAGALTPIERWLVVEHNSVVVYAGLIWETTYDRNTQTLSVSHEDIWSILDLRLIAETRTSAITTWKQTYSGLEYDTIVKRLVQLGTTGTGRTIPIQYEDDYTGGRTRTYYGYNLDTVLDAITEIMDLNDGPDIDFRPEWSAAGTIEWTLRTGDLSLNTIEFNLDAAHTDAAALKQISSGRERATLLLGVGEGTGGDMLVRPQGASGTFSLELVEQAKNIKNGAELLDFATSQRKPRITLINQYSMDLNLNSPMLENMWELRPGTLVRWHLTGDPAIKPDGWHTNTIIKYSGDITSSWIHLEFQ